MKFPALSAFILSCFLLTTTNASAQGGQDENPCEKAQTTIEMGECAGNEYQKADAELNSVYRQLMSSLSDRDYQSALKTAQQAWLKYRDANCEFETFDSRGGTIHPVVYSLCRAHMTRARTKDMRAAISQEGH
jgi:uncharacterized protein YecT (DUF1311 family)